MDMDMDFQQTLRINKASITVDFRPPTRKEREAFETAKITSVMSMKGEGQEKATAAVNELCLELSKKLILGAVFSGDIDTLPKWAASYAPDEAMGLLEEYYSNVMVELVSAFFAGSRPPQISDDKAFELGMAFLAKTNSEGVAVKNS